MVDRIATPRIAVVMATYNGVKYVREQVDSILAQSLKPELIVVGDDGSTDGTLDALAGYGEDLDVIAGPQAGYAHNFFLLLRQIPSDIDYVALCDQDDVWLPNKLERSVAMLGQPGVTPQLYGSRSTILSEDRRAGMLSRQIKKERIGLQHAVTQNFAGGNTFLINAAALRLVNQIEPPFPLVHDWFIYLLIAAAGGSIVHDDTPTLLYRQHDQNQIGSNTGIRGGLRRGIQMLNGTYRDWNQSNLDALEAFADSFPAETRDLLENVRIKRNGSLFERVSLFTSGVIYRQGPLGQIGLLASLLLKKF